ncbi:MAG: hypothetical protein K2K44_08630 [Oscillospiraceae bacterium]|nr:hypothetical protein [Oscillospiraceae bacterium]
MKKYFLGTFAAVALTLCISSCGNNPPEEKTEQTISEAASITTTSEISGTETTARVTEKVQSETVQDKDDEKIISLETPVIFATCFFDDAFPEFKGRSLVLEMTEGSYNSYNGYWDRAWEGKFRFRLTKSDEASHYEILDSDIISCPLELGFNEPFDISVDDYNNDGYPDFTINQWGSLSGGTHCYLFTLPKDRKVKPINYTVNDEQSEIFWLPKPYRSIYSPAFEKEGENCFSISFFTSGGVSNKNAFPLISGDVYDDWFLDHKDAVMSEFTIKSIYEWGDEFVVLKEQQILEPDGSIWYSSDVLRQYPHLKTLVDYILTDLQDEPSFIPSSMPENMIAIRLTDFNNDGNTDAFVSTASMGINYCMVDNINAPKLVYNFFAFDTADFLCDIKMGKLVIKYESHYGHFTNATSETNFIFVGDEITEISHVHFTGTSGPEEFYIVDENGEKTVCGEAEINASIAEIEKNLQPFDDDDTEMFRMTVNDSDIAIEKISD